MFTDLSLQVAMGSRAMRKKTISVFSCFASFGMFQFLDSE